MGIGYTRKDLEDVKTTGQPPVNSTDRPRSSKRQQLVDKMWQAFMDAQAWQQAQTGGRYGSPGRGRYAGFETRGEMDDYVRGRGLALDDEAAAWYDRISELTTAESGKIGKTYDEKLADARSHVDALMPRQLDVPEIASQWQNAPTSLENAYRQLQDPLARDAVIEMPGRAATPGRPVTFIPQPDDIWSAFSNVEWSEPTATFVAGSQPLGIKDNLPTEMRMVGGTPAVAPSTRRIGEEYWQSNVVPTGEDRRFAQYQTELGGWRDEELDRIGAYSDYASMLNDLDLHEWAQMAATNELGVDPSFAAGAWGPKMTLDHERALLGLEGMDLEAMQQDLAYANTGLALEGLPLKEREQQLDLWALENGYGSWDEYQTAEEERLKGETDDREYAANMAFADVPGIGGIPIGVDADALAEATDIPKDLLAEYVNDRDPNEPGPFEDAIAALTAIYMTPEGEWRGGELNGDPMLLANELAARDYRLYDILRNIYPDLLPRASIDG